MPRRLRFPSSAALPALQRGAALILALMTVALITGIAAAIIGGLDVAVDSAIGRHDQAQARLLARSAVDLARHLLADDARTSGVVHLGERWATGVQRTAVEGGEIAASIQDMSGRINLNDLVSQTGDDEGNIAVLLRLFEMLGLKDSQSLLAALLDWLDPDDTPRVPGGAESAWYGAQRVPRRAANTQLSSIEELGQVRGFSPEVVAALMPFVVALPGVSPVNVNTAGAEVLAATVPGLTLAMAQVVVTERQRAWFKDVADFTARQPSVPDETGAQEAMAQLSTGSRYFLVTGRARYGVAMVRMEALLERSENWPTIVWQRFP